MATSDKHFGQNQGGSTRRTESPESDSQQNHQASLKSETNRTDPESEQYTNEFINSVSCQRTPLKPVVQHYLKALIKITRLETKATHHLETLKKAQEKKQRTPLKPVVQHYLKALIKITRLETKATHHLETLKKALEDQ